MKKILLIQILYFQYKNIQIRILKIIQDKMRLNDFFVYNNNGNRGIGCSILNLQKMKDGPVLGGHSRAEDDFADLDDEEDFLG